MTCKEKRWNTFWKAMCNDYLSNEMEFLIFCLSISSNIYSLFWALILCINHWRCTSRSDRVNWMARRFGRLNRRTDWLLMVIFCNFPANAVEIIDLDWMNNRDMLASLLYYLLKISEKEMFIFWMKSTQTIQIYDAIYSWFV